MRCEAAKIDGWPHGCESAQSMRWGGGGQLTSGSRICIDIGRFESNSRLELPLVADVYHQDMG